MGAISDQELLAKYARTRDDADFRPLVVRYAPLVFRACLARLGRHHLAEDATQCVFILLAQKAARVRSGATLVPWLLAAAKRCSQRIARTEARRHAHEAPLEDDVPFGGEDPSFGLVAALEGLRGDERDAIVLRVVQGLSFAEVGERLGLTEDAARMRVRRGLSRLRTRLGPIAGLAPAFIDRLSSPSLAEPTFRFATPRRNLTLNTGRLILVPIVAAILCAPLVLTKQGFGGSVPSKNTVRQQPVASKPSPHSDKSKFRFRFDDYFGKSPDWFEKNVGPSNGAIQWRTFRRRDDLGGGLARLGSASYTIGDPMNGNVLSIDFDGTTGKKPAATHVAHGIARTTVGHTLLQELTYVGITLTDYRRVPNDRSYPDGTQLYVKKTDPQRLLVVIPLNGGYQIELDRHFQASGRQP